MRIQRVVNQNSISPFDNHRLCLISWPYSACLFLAPTLHNRPPHISLLLAFLSDKPESLLVYGATVRRAHTFTINEQTWPIYTPHDAPEKGRYDPDHDLKKMPQLETYN